MPRELRYNQDLKIIELKYQGSVRAAAVQVDVRARFDLSQKHNCHLFLGDLVEANIEMTASDIFRVPASFGTIGFDRTSKIALLLPKDKKSQKWVYLYKSLCLKRGWQVSIFSARPAAVAWLTTADA